MKIVLSIYLYTDLLNDILFQGIKVLHNGVQLCWGKQDLNNWIERTSILEKSRLSFNF